MTTGEADDGAGDAASIALHLYALPLAAFTPERNALAKQVRTRDRDLASRIATLPKPSASAWLVNRLVAEGTEDLRQVLELGTAFRQAQRDADRVRLRQLSTRRRELLDEVAERTAAGAAQAGAHPSAAVLEEFQQTLQSALVSTAAAAAVGSGHLVRALRADGLDPVDLSDAVAFPERLDPEDDEVAPAPAPEQTTGGGAEDRDATALAEAEHRAAEAGRRTDVLQRESVDAAGRAAAAEALAEERTRAAAALRAELEELHSRSTAADEAADAAQHESTRARASASDAARAAEAAAAESEDAARSLTRLRRPR